jgi:hypothetical protein
MATIVTKYSDYEVHSIEFFIEKIQAELVFRDLKGLTNEKVQKINVTKQHPLVALMAAQLRSNPADDVLRSGLLPAISVTPGNVKDEDTLGLGSGSGIVNAAFIANLQSFQSETDKNRLDSGMITSDQIDLIVAAYNAQDAGNVLYTVNTWRKHETINISSWGSNPDIDFLISNLLDSILKEIQVGFMGDNSPIVDLQFNVSKGLTNFNYGRVLHGTEYNLTFLNTFHNYTIVTETKISEHDPDFTYLTPGES